MGKQSFSWALFKREGLAAVKFVFGDGAYDLQDPGSCKQICNIIAAVLVVFGLVVWVWRLLARVHNLIAQYKQEC